MDQGENHDTGTASPVHDEMPDVRLLDPEVLQLFADAYPDGIVGADFTRRVTVINREAARLLGITPDQAIGRPLPEVLRLEDHDGVEWSDYNQPWEPFVLRRGIPEQSWLLPSGDEVLTTARILRRPRVARVSGISVSLRSGRGRARLDRERSDLVATVAHELRSPLTGVKGFVQALLSRWDKLNDEQKKLMLATVNADADRLNRLIAELLDVARIDTDRLSLFPRPSDAEVLTRRVVDSVSAGTSTPVNLVVEAGAVDSVPRILVDPDKFTQVITNLVENGVRHGEGTVTVTIAADSTSPAAPVMVRVEDQGEGIPIEMRKRVFTKFWKHGDRGGSGLGMYIVNGLVTAHGGRLSIEEAPGGGARITTLWPVDSDGDENR